MVQFRPWKDYVLFVQKILIFIAQQKLKESKVFSFDSFVLVSSPQSSPSSLVLEDPTRLILIESIPKKIV